MTDSEQAGPGLAGPAEQAPRAEPAPSAEEVAAMMLATRVLVAITARSVAAIEDR
ncbi:MAG TPA: hypothetical protein VFQ77_13965 [Pseudonocardiaceae bacterium]|jgi:hypothetical protein|nr:hypothetical protein [Pseudonocardiaceae bacterium]